MLNVPDVPEAVAWYENIGFETQRTNQQWEPDDEINWAFISCGNAELMLNARASDAVANSAVTLYFNVEDCDKFFDYLKDRVEVLYEPSSQFYGMRDFEIRDLNGNSLIFGQNLDVPV